MTTLETNPSAPVLRPLSPVSCGTETVSVTVAISASGLLWDACAPVVEQLPQVEVEKRLGGDDPVQRTETARQREQVPPVGADQLNEQVEAPRRYDDVAGLVPLRDCVRQ